MTKNKSLKSFIAGFMVVIILISLIPGMKVFAAQSNEYVDPADVWMEANSRTNELDINATVTYEVSFCNVCVRPTQTMVYRVPEYTKSGDTAYNHGVFYSDGTSYDRESKGNINGGTPGVDAHYTGCHWSKSVCQTCGTINGVNATYIYGFNKNVYMLNACDSNFFLDFDNTIYEGHDEDCHTTILKKGQYCQFCKGTYARAVKKVEEHNFSETTEGQVSHNRFYLTDTCDDCGYTEHDYVTAKSVVTSFYGYADGEAHTIDVTDLSDRGVKTSIRYGKEADKCTKTSAPNYTAAGFYRVYYEITYSYAKESMSENGAAYVWLLDKAENDSDNDGNGGGENNAEAVHTHDYRYLETVNSSCTNLGYEVWQCAGCGSLDRKNYSPALGHSYKTTTVRNASCTEGGLILHICSKCGDFYEETTGIGAHDYESKYVSTTCKSVGYTEHICKICGDRYITDIVPLTDHNFTNVIKAPSCTNQGYTTSICKVCNLTLTSDYTEAKGHDWDNGHTVNLRAVRAKELRSMSVKIAVR